MKKGTEREGEGGARYVSEKLEENGKFIAAARTRRARFHPSRAVKDDAC